MVVIFKMSAEFATLGFLKMKVFWNKCYDVVISVCDIINKILSGDTNYNVDVVVQPKFRKSSISMRKVIITPVL